MRRRIARRALHDAEVLVDRHDGPERAARVLHRAAAGRNDHRLADAGDLLQERRVRQIARRDLVGGHVDRGEQIRRRRIEGGREEQDANLPGIGGQRAILLAVELQRLAMFAVGRRIGVLAVVRAVVQFLIEQRPVIALLQLHRVGTGLLGGLEHGHALLQVALVIVADLGDDVGGAVVGDGLVADRENASHCPLPGDMRAEHLAVERKLGRIEAHRTTTRAHSSAAAPTLRSSIGRVTFL